MEGICCICCWAGPHKGSSKQMQFLYLIVIKTVVIYTNLHFPTFLWTGLDAFFQTL